MQLRQGSLRYRQLNDHRRPVTCAVTLGGDLAGIGADESVGDPETKPGTAGRGGMTLATREAVLDFCCFGCGQSRALVGDADVQVGVLRSR